MGRIKMKQVEGLGNVTVETAIEEFLKNCRLRNLSPKTIRYYEEDLQYFARNISAKKANEINRQTLDDFILHEMDKGNRVTAINTRLRGIRVFIRFCAERDYAEELKYPLLKEDETVKTPYTDEELQRLLKRPTSNSWTEWRVWAVINTFLATGIRASTLLSIRIKDVDFEQNTILLTKLKNRKQQMIKTLNEGTRNNIDYIHTAISEDKQITFKYFNYDTNLKKQYRKRGAKYTISPYVLVYSDENYYLLAYDKTHKEIRPYRVDRMEGVNIIGESVREGKEAFDAIDMRKFQKYTFSMYTGEVKEVTMVFTNDMMNSVVDRFGRDIFVNKEDDYHFRISVEVAVSPQFYGWVFGLGKKVRIAGPEDVRQDYLDMLKGVQEKYE